MKPTLHVHRSRSMGPRGRGEASPELSGGSSGRILLRLILIVLLALIIGSVAVQRGAGSLPKDDVREQTLAIPKNAVFAAAMRTVELPGDVDSPAYGAFFPGGAAEAAEGEAGPGAASGASPLPPIVFVHGTPDTMGAFEPLLFGAGGVREALGGRGDIWTLEVCGHGIAPTNDEAYPFQRCADYVAASIEAFGLSAVTLVGNSYGAEFCWRAAADHPELIERLVLIDSSGLPRTEDQFLSEEVKMREWSVARLGYLANSEPRVKSALDPHFDGAADGGRVHEVFLGLENRGNWNAMIDLVRDENGERREDLALIQAKTLLVWGEHDEAYGPETFGREFERRIPDARLFVVEGAGHYPHEQRPAVVGAEVVRFHLEGRE